MAGLLISRSRDDTSIALSLRFVCDTVVKVSSDGLLFAKNSDRDANESQFLEWHPRIVHEPQETLRCTWIEIPQVGVTNAIVISRPWWMWGAEMGANEHGVVIGNEAVFTNQAKGEPALLGMDLLRIALERSASASEAAEVITRLLEEFGQGGPCSHERPGFTYHNSFLIADTKGAIVLETAGTRWASEEVRSGVRSISNGLSIAPFAAQYSKRLRTAVSGCALRRERTESSAANADGPGAMMRTLRDHGVTGAPHWSPLNGTLRAPCVHAGGYVASSQTTASFVSDLRGDALHWATASSAPCVSIFKPIRIGEPVSLGPEPTNRYDPESTWWRHERVHRSIMRNYDALATRYQERRDSLEAEWTVNPPSSASAFNEASLADDEWLKSHGLLERDTRPYFVRRLWRQLDDLCGI